MDNMEIRKDIKYNENNYEAHIDMRTKTVILH